MKILHQLITKLPTRTNQICIAWCCAALARLLDYLLARALLAAYRDRNYRPWIAIARRVARFVERRGRAW